jgi:hypothetical protein
MCRALESRFFGGSERAVVPQAAADELVKLLLFDVMTRGSPCEPIQALDRTQPELPMKPGRAGTMARPVAICCGRREQTAAAYPQANIHRRQRGMGI